MTLDTEDILNIQDDFIWPFWPHISSTQETPIKHIILNACKRDGKIWFL